MLLHFFEGVYPYIEFAILVQSKLMLVQDRKNHLEKVLGCKNLILN